MKRKTMTLKEVFDKKITLIHQPSWNRYRHVELTRIVDKKKAQEGIRAHTIAPVSVVRDKTGELGAKTLYLHKDGWLEWVAPPQILKKAEEFGWKSYRWNGKTAYC